jgi:chemotaxis methyl-accepting protein methylase
MTLTKFYGEARKFLTKNRLRVSTTTGFFRNDVQMETILRLLPAPKLVYVFGCSDGCESYSFAIHLRLHKVSPAPKIRGYDINEECILKARRALYERQQMDYYGTGENLTGPKAQFFQLVGSNQFRVDESIASTCDFDLGSVLDDAFMAQLPKADLVFCQNVLIHLEPEQNRVALRNLQGLVADGGLLAIGGMRPELRSALTTEAKLEPVVEDCRVIHDGWRDLRNWWEESKPWAREYFALERFEETPDWPHRYSSLFKVPAGEK